jgi:hypothetical protein
MTMSWISLFVVHGIRDDGYWTRKIAQKIREAAEKGSLRGEPSFGKLQCNMIVSPGSCSALIGAKIELIVAWLNTCRLFFFPLISRVPRPPVWGALEA